MPSGSIYAWGSGVVIFVAGLLVGALWRRRSTSSRPEPARGLFEAAAQAVVITDFSGRIVKMNPQAVELLGALPAESKFQERLPAPQRKAFESLLGSIDASASGERSLETTALRPDGTEFPLECGLRRTSLGDQAWLSVVLRDVSERRREESKVQQGRRLEALGRLAGGVAHDFNNVLTAVMGYAELLKTSLADRPELAAHADEVLRAGELAGGLTRQLLAFSRKQVVEPKILAVNPVLDGMSGMIRRLVREDIEIKTELGEGLPPVEADPTQIQQVLMNLVINARDALAPGGRITLRTYAANVSELDAARHPHAGSGPHVVLEVADTGHGMDKETQAHIFEPFFTTKRGSGGSGLGLATSYGIVRQARGHIRLLSAPGRGTTFSVYLPASAERETPTAVAALPTAGRGRETVFIVEDSAVILRLSEETLRRQGYTVLTAPDGQSALERVEASNLEFDLLMTDIVMPRLSGYDLAKRLASSRPRLKVLYVSGYADSTYVNADFLRSRPEFLKKPFTPSALALKVREVLDSNKTFHLSKPA